MCSMYALYVHCLICTLYMCALYVRLICMPYMYALYVRLVCTPYMYALYACLVCVSYMSNPQIPLGTNLNPKALTLNP
jgi:hypothetical protein